MERKHSLLNTERNTKVQPQSNTSKEERSKDGTQEIEFVKPGEDGVLLELEYTLKVEEALEALLELLLLSVSSAAAFASAAGGPEAEVVMAMLSSLKTEAHTTQVVMTLTFISMTTHTIQEVEAIMMMEATTMIMVMIMAMTMEMTMATTIMVTMMEATTVVMMEEVMMAVMAVTIDPLSPLFSLFLKPDFLKYSYEIYNIFLIQIFNIFYCGYIW